MSGAKTEIVQSEEICRSWGMYLSSEKEIFKMQKEVDKIFSGYSFYPEIDWKQYGYRPPQGYQVLGAWRHPKTRVFAFLLNNPFMTTKKPTTQLILYIAGETVEILTLVPKLEILKTNFESEDRKGEVDTYVGERLNRVHKSKSLRILAGILTIFTAIINGFSLYFRKLPPPELGSEGLIKFYKAVIALVHFSALILLLFLIIICAIFLIKYGILLIKRL